MGFLRTQFQEEQLEFKAKERPAAQSVGTMLTVDNFFVSVKFFLRVCVKDFYLRGILVIADT